MYLCQGWGVRRLTQCNEILWTNSHSGCTRLCFYFIYLIADVILVIGLYLSALPVWENANIFWMLLPTSPFHCLRTSLEFPSLPALLLLNIQRKCDFRWWGSVGRIYWNGALSYFFLHKCKSAFCLKIVCSFSIVKKTEEHVVTFIIVLRVAVIKSSQYLKIVLVPLLGFILALIIG